MSPEMLAMPIAERRKDSREIVTHAVKAQCQLTGRYFGGRTRDLSRSGALIELDTPSLLVPGQEIAVAIVPGAGQGLIRRQDMVSATVVRTAGFRSQQSVAVQFGHRQALQAA